MALGDLRAVQAVDDLIEVLVKDWCAEVRASAASALGEISASQAIPYLIQALGSVILNVKKNAVQALVKMGQEALEPLTQALSHPDPEVRKQVVWALGERREVGSLRPLLLALKDDDWEVRQGAAEALGKIDRQWPASPQAVAVVPQLIEALDKQALRPWVSRILLKIGKPAVPFLSRSLRTAPLDTQPFIAWLLGEIRDRQAFPELLEAFLFGQEATAEAAATALQNLDPNWHLRPEARKFLPQLSQLLKDPEPERRRRGARALGIFRDSSAIPDLLEALADTETVQAEAAAALAAITGKNFGKDLSRWQKWWRVHQGRYSQVS